MPTEPERCAGTDGCFFSAQMDKANGLPPSPCRLPPAGGRGDGGEGGLPEVLLDAALAEQRRDWVAGKRTPAAERLRQDPGLASHPAQAAELVYHEFVLREELGQS